MFKDGEAQAAMVGAPAFTPVASRLLDLLACAGGVAEQVAALLRLDAESVSEILQLPDSQAYGIGRHIRCVAHVVALLGAARLRGLIATLALRRTGGDGAALRGYWRHSVAASFKAAGRPPGFALEAGQAENCELTYEHRPWVSHGGVPVARRNPSCEGAQGQVLGTDTAYGFAELSGFPAVEEIAAQTGLAELLATLPRAVRRALPSELARLARAMDGNLTMINN